MSEAAFLIKTHNPDVLSCIAYLSNDEVSTPPELVNQILNILEQTWSERNKGESIWENKNVTFLDPCTKSGVFLREIVKRLNSGLSKKIPDLTERINHIMSNQVFGIAITELTSLVSRRSLYCSKNANGIHSIARSLTTPEGNIWFERVEHGWTRARCRYCGANENEYNRGNELETHAYSFIHCEDIKNYITTLFGDEMHFDVIIGNPPYHLNDGGHGASAKAIYHLFVEQAKKLEPRFLSMVIPSRWFAGGKGLDGFRNSMLNDDRIRVIQDFVDSSQIFPGTQIKGGVMYFLWDRDNPGNAKISTNIKGMPAINSNRKLLEPGLDIFVRYGMGLEILAKIVRVENKNKTSENFLSIPAQKKFENLVSVRKPFGLSTDFRGKNSNSKNDLRCYQLGGISYIAENEIKSGKELVDKYKVFVAYAGSGDQHPSTVISRPFLGSRNEVCTETYLAIGPFHTKEESINVAKYISTRFFRFLLMLRKSSQHVTKNVYGFIPVQDFSKNLSDEELYKKYNFSIAEIQFIEAMVRPMELHFD